MKNITPKKFQCAAGLCPAVYEEGENLFIIGKKVEGLPEVEKKAGRDEQVVMVRKEMLKKALNKESN